MIAVGYFDGSVRRGLLVWTHDYQGIVHALGGIDHTPDHPTPERPYTVVTTDQDERLLVGWIHPDQIMEVSGQDGPGVRCVS